LAWQCCIYMIPYGFVSERNTYELPAACGGVISRAPGVVACSDPSRRLRHSRAPSKLPNDHARHGCGCWFQSTPLFFPHPPRSVSRLRCVLKIGARNLALTARAREKTRATCVRGTGDERKSSPPCPPISVLHTSTGQDKRKTFSTSNSQSTLKSRGEGEEGGTFSFVARWYSCFIRHRVCETFGMRSHLGWSNLFVKV